MVRSCRWLLVAWADATLPPTHPHHTTLPTRTDRPTNRSTDRPTTRRLLFACTIDVLVKKRDSSGTTASSGRESYESGRLESQVWLVELVGVFFLAQQRILFISPPRYISAIRKVGCTMIMFALGATLSMGGTFWTSKHPGLPAAHAIVAFVYSRIPPATIMGVNGMASFVGVCGLILGVVYGIMHR